MPTDGHSHGFRVAAGTRLNGVYEIEHLIGGGGMGEVYKGHNIQTGDPVAIKLMLPELSGNAEAMALFRREASTLHNLYHEAIVRYFVFSVDPEIGRAYLAMEFVDGPSLSDRLRQGPLDLASVRLLQRRLGDALDVAHRLGVIHRDISPDNIILPGGDVRRAKVIDFGIARSQAAPEGTIIGGGFAGKFSYVSPEQLGLAGGEVTGKSDIYSLGLVLAEALRGKPLDMGGTQYQVIEKRRTVPDLGDIDRAIRPLIAAMLQPDPKDRPQTMAEVAAWQPTPPAERTIIRPRPQDAVQPPKRPGAAPAERRGGGIALGLLVLLLLVAGGGVGAHLAGAPELAWLGVDATTEVADTPDEDQASAPDLAEAPDALPPLEPDNAPPPLGPLEPEVATPAAEAERPRLDTVVTDVGAPPAEQGEPDAGVLDGAELANQLAELAGNGRTFPATDDGEAGAAEPQPDPAPADDVAVAEEPTPEPLPAPNTPPTAPRSRLVLAEATAGVAYAAALPPFSDAETPREITLGVDGTLPQGLALTDHGAGFGTIAGIAAAEGRFAFSVVATDPEGASVRMPTEISVVAAPAPEPPQPTPPTRSDIAAFVADYDGGPCVFLRTTEVADASAVVEGFGAAIPPFESLERDFIARAGYEPDIALRLISNRQCPVVDLIEDAGFDPVRAPVVEITGYSVGAGHPLAGTIQNASGRTLAMMLVADDGTATSLDRFLTPARDGASFSVPLVPDAGSRGAGQLLLVIASDAPLPSLAGFDSGPADAIASRLAADLDGEAQAAVELVYFRFANE